MRHRMNYLDFHQAAYVITSYSIHYTKLYDDAEKKLAEYEARFRNLEQESEQIVEDYIKQGEDAKKRILAEAEAQAEKLEDMAKRNIEQEFKAAKALLKQEVVDRAMEQAEALIKKSITTQDQNRLVDEYLKKVEA